MFYFLLSALFLFGSLESAETNPWDLSIRERIINRKHVSHIVIETRADHVRVALLLSERYPYNYKSGSGSFLSERTMKKRRWKFRKNWIGIWNRVGI